VVEKVHSSNVLSVALHPDPDQAWVLTGAVDRTMALTDLATGAILWRSPPRAGSVLSVDIHPTDSSIFLSGDMSGRTVIVRARVGDPAAAVQAKMLSFLGSEGISVQPVDPNSALIPEGPDAEEQLASFEDHTKYIVRAKWAPDGSGAFVTASYDRTVCLYEPTPSEEATPEVETVAGTSGGWRLKHRWHFPGTVECVIWKGSDRLIVSVRESHMLRVLDCDDLSIEEINLNPNLDDWVSFTAMDLALSPDSKFILVATDKSKLLLYKLGFSTQFRQFFGCDNDDYANPRCCWHPNMLYVYCTGQDNNVHVWEVASQKHVGVLAGHEKAIRAMVSGNGGIVTGSYDQSVRLWL